MTRIAAVVLALASAGCGGKIYEIHNGSTKVNGVPFYVVSGSCTQETVSLETLYQVSIQVPKTEVTPAIVLMEKVVPSSIYASPVMQQLRDAVTVPSPNVSTIIDRFKALKIYDPQAAPELVQVSNTSKADTFVDYSKVHYINVSRPGMGSASATAKLNANGTLAETSGEVEDKTAETILGAFPISETVLGILTNAGALGPMMSVGGTDPATPRPLQLVITPTRFKHTWAKTEKADPPCPGKAPLTPTTAANVRREALTDGAGEKDENAIGVSGKIVLPKKGGE